MLMAGGTHDLHNSAPELTGHTPPPLPDHAGSIPANKHNLLILPSDKVEAFVLMWPLLSAGWLVDQLHLDTA